MSAGGDVARAREFTLGRVPANVTVNANLNLRVNATGDLGFVIPTYVFATPVFGGQASASLVGAYGVVSTTLAGQLSGNLTGPGGGSIPFMRSDSFSDTTWGFGDLIPQFALRWILMFPEVTSAIAGSKNPEQVEDNVRAATLPPLSHEKMDRVREIYDTYIRPQVHHRW